MKQMRRLVLMIPIALTFSMLGMLACEQDPAPLPSSCYWRDRMGEAFDEYISAPSLADSERSMRIATVYLYLHKRTRESEMNSGIYLDCSVEPPEWPNTPIYVPKSMDHELTSH